MEWKGIFRVMNDILLTFGIPVYNTGCYIEELLSCFKSVPSFNYEIIIIDDGSTDNTFEICSEIIKNKKNLDIKLISQKNQGVSQTRNNIIKYATGKWITFIDSDDLINFDLYYQNFLALVNTGLDLFINVFNKENYNKLKSNGFHLSFLIENEIINSPWTKFYKKDILLKNKIEFKSDINLGEDLLFNLMVYSKSNNIDYFYSDMYNYRLININSLTKKYRSDKFEQLMKLNKYCYKYVANDKKNCKALEYIKIKNSISCLSDYTKIYSNYEVLDKIKKIKSIYRRKYYILNNFYTTLIYNFWYLCPNKMLVKIVEMRKK